jgi:hypothetical protein
MGKRAMMAEKKVAVLFIQKNSAYLDIPEADCYDIERNALTYADKLPVVAHPPCRLWGRLRGLSTAPIEEKKLAIFAVEAVRRCGGVLEHPAGSTLWKEMELPKPGCGYDKFGGWTLEIDQHWFGYPAKKNTWLYIVGLKPNELPNYTLNLFAITHLVHTSSRKNRRLSYLSKSKQSYTMPKLTRWLVEIAISTCIGQEI